MSTALHSDWHLESAKILRAKGLLQIDFTGFKPTHDDVQTTSIFLHHDYRPTLLYDAQPLSGVGARVARSLQDRSHRETRG